MDWIVIHSVTYQRSRSPNNHALVVVLGTMARADEFFFSSIPWNHTTQMCADCINAIGCQSPVILHNKVGWVSLQIRISKSLPTPLKLV